MRKFHLEQMDRKVKFAKCFIPAAKEAKLKETIFKIATTFAKHGRSAKNVATYQKLDQIFMEMALGSTHKVSPKKFGYMQNLELTLRCRIFILSKIILDCKSRNTPLTEII